MPTAICSNCQRQVAYSEEAEHVFCIWCGASITPGAGDPDVEPSDDRIEDAAAAYDSAAKELHAPGFVRSNTQIDAEEI